MKIYLIYECDSHRATSSVVIKWMTTAQAKALEFYEDYVENYLGDRTWYFNVGFYEIPEGDCSDESNALRDIEIIKTTEL